KIDAAKIAAFGLTYWQDLKAAKPTDEVYRELRLLSRQYFQLTSMLVNAKISLNNLLDNVMPGITDLLYDREPHHKLTDFVLRYLHFDKISAMGEKKFISGYCAWAKKQGYRMYERQAEEIFALVQNSIPALPMTASTTIVVKEAIKVVRELENSRASILAQMQTFAKSLPEYSLIREMACVGDTLTPLVIAEIGDVRNFHSKHALIAYAGIDAPPYQSGGFYGTERHISKRGNGYLRHVGFEIMQCKHINPDLKIDGILLTLVDHRTNLAKSTVEALHRNFGNQIKMYRTQIPIAVKAAEVSSKGQSIYAYEPNSTVARAYTMFTKEVLADGDRKKERLRSSDAR
ncbi:MAG: transposase, partial [Clostridiales bacterium]|nr:transposase [Clostridiales bacterium]